MIEPERHSRLSWADRWFALQSIFLLQGIAWSLRWFGLKRVYGWLNRSPAPPTSRARNIASARRQALRLGAVVGTANRRFKPLRVACLPESVTVWWLLRKRGIPPDR